jgi:hypothetical protein
MWLSYMNFKLIDVNKILFNLRGFIVLFKCNG